MHGARVAVLGAGTLGTTVALELARRGYGVDLLDRGPQPITMAGLRNEGKLHLGFVYANDGTRRTSDLVASGSVRFFGLLRRWIGADVDRLPVSSPFVYAVPNDSLLSPAQVLVHFEHVAAATALHVAEAQAAGIAVSDIQRSVVPGQGVSPLSAAELSRWFAPDRVAAAYVVPEIAVDPYAVAVALRSAVGRSPAIRFFPHTNVERVDGDDGTLTVVMADGASRGPYAHVVNALWDGRLPIDLARGHRPSQPWLWRSKLSVRVSLALTSVDLPSVTYLLGPFGDMVDYQNGSSYLSWYPAGLQGLSSDPTPPAAWAQIDAHTRTSVARASLLGLAELAPRLRALPAEALREAELVGGAIFAYGESDIDDPDSGLHQRSGPAVRSWGGYHSVDPGKFCLAPLFAMDVADRITERLG